MTSLASRLTIYRIVMATTAAAVVAVIAISLSGARSYTVTVEMPSADGLLTGAPVKVGGVQAGTITSLGLGRHDVVKAVLSLDPKQGQIGEGARVSIVTSNLLGAKFIQLTPGDSAHPRPSGSVLPASVVSYPTDLDQILNVLDPDTRVRLQIAINELGMALTGRRADFSAALQLLPHDLSAGRELLSQVVTDNHTLAALVVHAGSFVHAVNGQRAQLIRLVDAASQTLTTTAEHQAAMAAILSRAPGTLQTTQRFLARLEITTAPLTTAAHALSATAPALTNTLAQLPSFQRAARPVLREAVAVSPALTRLGVRGTPVVRQLSPTLASLSKFLTTTPPLTSALNSSVDNILAVLEGWARAIQGRDGLGHIFHGRAVMTSSVMRSLVAATTGVNLPVPLSARGGSSSGQGLTVPSAKASFPGLGSSSGSSPNPGAPRNANSGSNPAPGAPATSGSGSQSLGSLLRYLLAP